MFSNWKKIFSLLSPRARFCIHVPVQKYGLCKNVRNSIKNARMVSKDTLTVGKYSDKVLFVDNASKKWMRGFIHKYVNTYQDNAFYTCLK